MKNYFTSFFVLAFCLLSPLQAAEPDYLTLTNTSNSSATLYFRRTSAGNYSNTINIEWSINGGAWSDPRTNKYDNATITVPAGQSVRFRGNNTTVQNGVTKCKFNGSKSIYWFFYSKQGKFTASGDVMSIAAYDEATNTIHDEYPLADYCFYSLFYYGSNSGFITLEDASELRLPSTQLGKYCYGDMFRQANALTKVPVLPATELADNCYNGMFASCRALTSPPALPSMTLANGCYTSMFKDCTALTTAPNLPATILTEGCYNAMFNGCTALVNVQPELPGTNLPKNCYYEMFSGCTALKTAPEIMADENATVGQAACYNMFTGCTNLTKAPSVLRPRTLNVNQVYYNMFLNCSSLQRGPDVWATSIPLVGSNQNNSLYGLYQRATSLTHIRVHFKAWGSMSFCNQWSVSLPKSGDFYCPPELERNFTNSSWNHIPYSPDYPWTVFSYNLTYIPVGGEWPKGGTDPQQYTWQTDTNYVQGWMRELDAAGAAYYHDEACTQSFPESEIIAFLATQQESSSSITKNIYVKLGVVDYPESERYEYVSFPLEEEDQHEFECSPGSTPDPETPEGNTCDHNWVQLWEGGPKWATVNIGATTETEAGNYYMWGSTDATATCLWNYYPYKGSNKNTAPYTKYGYASDGLIELEAGDDAAAKEWGCGWRTPTKAEMDDLKVYCNYTYDAVNRGIRFTSKSNGQSIFLRSAGYKGNGSTNGTTIFIDANNNDNNYGKGNYMTSTSTTSPGSNKYADCYYLYWYTKTGYMTLDRQPATTTGDRCTGMSVRAVHD